MARLFRLTAIIEAISWICLLIAMGFKYGPADNPIGVQIIGPIHGVAFLAYVAATIGAARAFRWSLPLTLVGLAASLPPAATLPFEIYAARRGALERND